MPALGQKGTNCHACEENGNWNADNDRRYDEQRNKFVAIYVAERAVAVQAYISGLFRMQRAT